MSTQPVAIVATVTAEIAPLARRLKLRPDRALLDGRTVMIDQTDSPAIALVTTGIGAERAVACIGVLIDRMRPSCLYHVGFAGALLPTLRIADVICPVEIINATTGTRYRPTAGIDQRGTLVTVDRSVSTPEQNAQLRQTSHADAVDMESAAVAALCAVHGVPYASVRAISDEANTALPKELAKLVQPDGSVRFTAAIGYVLRHPEHLPALIRLSRASRRAAHALAGHIEQLLQQSTDRA